MVNARNSDKYHIFHNIWVYANGVVFKVQAMIDIRTIYNLIAQDLVNKYKIPGNNKMLSLMATTGDRLYLYKQYQVAIGTYEYNSLWTSDVITIYRSNITGCKLILGMPWIKKTRPAFN